MPAFSPLPGTIFKTEPKAALHIGGFPDFYALLDLPRDASAAQLEAAITLRAADLLAASFSRSSKNELWRLSNRYIADLRPVLLDPAARLAYDEQLRRHEDADFRALPYAQWKQTTVAQRPSGLNRASRGLRAHLKTVLWDAEFI